MELVPGCFERQVIVFLLEGQVHQHIEGEAAMSRGYSGLVDRRLKVVLSFFRTAYGLVCQTPVQQTRNELGMLCEDQVGLADGLPYNPSF